MNILSVASITPFILTYRYTLVFALTIIEGPIITMLAGFFIMNKIFNPFWAFATIASAEMISDSLYYLFGRWGGKKLAERFAKFTKLTERRLGFFEKVFRNHPGKTLVIGKITHVIGVPVLIAAGVGKVRPSCFLLYDLLATLPKTLVFLLIGYYVGHASETIDRYLTYSTITVSSLLILIFVIYLLIGAYTEKKLFN